MSDPLILLDRVFKEYRSADVVTPVLHEISFGVEAGEFIALMGPSGSGKSTLMNILGFLDRLTTGTYRFQSRDVTQFANDDLAHLRRDAVGFIFQSFHLLPKSTVLQNVMLPMLYSGVSGDERTRRATEALESVGLTHRLSYVSNQLSGGERQRVAIARSLVNQPSVIFADEPTGNLDTKSGTDVLTILQNLNRQGRTIIMVTHEREAAEYAGRIIRLRDGRIVSDEKNGSQRTGEYRK